MLRVDESGAQKDYTHGSSSLDVALSILDIADDLAAGVQSWLKKGYGKWYSYIRYLDPLNDDVAGANGLSCWRLGSRTEVNHGK